MDFIRKLDFDFSKEIRMDIMNILISHGADIDAKDKFGATVLHYAVIFRNTELIRLIISLGADVNARNKNGKSPLHFAMQKFYWDDIEATIPQLKKGLSKLYQEIIEILVSHGADVNGKDLKGKSILQYATKYKHTAIIEYLISQGSTDN